MLSLCPNIIADVYLTMLLEIRCLSEYCVLRATSRLRVMDGSCFWNSLALISVPVSRFGETEFHAAFDRENNDGFGLRILRWLWATWSWLWVVEWIKDTQQTLYSQWMVFGPKLLFSSIEFWACRFVRDCLKEADDEVQGESTQAVFASTQLFWVVSTIRMEIPWRA